MTLLTAGWWQTTWWPSQWWHEDWWLEYGTAAAVTPSRGGAVRRRTRIVERPRSFLGTRQLELLRDYVRLKLGEDNA